MAYYHDGMRELQDRYDGREIPDRLAKNSMRTAFNDEDRAFVEASQMFFLSTASEESVDCSLKAGDPGFVRVMGDNVIAWPDYDGNRMYRSLGNIIRNSRVGVLFVSFDGTLYNNAGRLRINGHAEIDESPEAIAGMPGAKRLIRVTAEHIFSNCPRYIPKMTLEEPSVYVPRKGHTPPVPAWKKMPFVAEVFDNEDEPAGGD
ncbi:MAG: pyridoxamine 5'-phosphate oxidase family protein [Hyphomicrobiales bacterium]|nr:pyridoxamine 5'-phosphate oxidase family protein [Hyphomicrobiales bacterium]MCP5000378.1 pyridoxamine 5'-phosphate oxidase family protein [Hyphomicrobiales bacterium]